MASRFAPPAAAFSRIPFSICRLLSSSCEKLCHEDRSAGISEFLIQLPQAYWKKSTQGSTLLSMFAMLNSSLAEPEDVDWQIASELRAKRNMSNRRNGRMSKLPCGIPRTILSPALGISKPRNSWAPVNLCAPCGEAFAACVLRRHPNAFIIGIQRIRKKGWPSHDFQQWFQRRRLHRPQTARRMDLPPKRGKNT